MDNENICTVCQKKENDANKIVTCLYCFASAHLKCKNIIGNACRRVREKPYFCTPDCAEIYQRIIEMSNNKQSMIEALTTELKSIVAHAVSSEMLNFRSEIRLITTAIENSQEFLSTKFDAISDEFNRLKLENDDLKLEILRLKKSYSALTETVHKLELNTDKTSRIMNEKNAVFMGIPITHNENTTQLIEKAIQVLGVQLQSGSIKTAFRISSKNTSNKALVPIKVVFNELNDKENVFEKKRQNGKLLSTAIDPSLLLNGRPTTVSIRDELTPLSSELLRELRESQEVLKIKYVWPGRNGAILVKKGEGDRPDVIRSRDDLSKFMTKFLNTVMTPSPKRKRFENNN